ncbi:MAG: MgpA protein [Berkelbacteria bacterium GW2011_GWB1_38_5]|uniref:MgpA protein n=2 Tax=Candidatus Berkelbacteria TaxID=1618330 RepID=A0A0G0PN67_9BACT|nr:MAG: MgpA protein [Berkelbacteria bacterium GW2011_GWB1_38_5]KKQ90751.1 MAG: MgpA protein [Berkelbacteria bacterium GW2011_GWA1_39_10]
MFHKVISKIKNYQKILLMIHEDPDGDTLAATVAMFMVLKELGKETSMVCKDSIPQPFLFLKEVSKIQKDVLFGDFEVIVIIDCGDLKRTGFPERLKKFAKNYRNLINIDHHPKNDLWKIANLNLVDQKASSVSEIVWQLIKEMNVPITRDIATAILTGIYTDTGGFKHSNTSPETLKISSELLNYGARLKEITRNVSLNKSIASLKLWGIALSRIHKNQDLGFVSSVITLKDLATCKATYYDLTGVVNLMNSIPDSKAAVLFFETPDGQIRASIRTEKDDVDVSKIAKLFGGGGHKKAAGFTVSADLKLNGKNWEIVLK